MMQEHALKRGELLRPPLVLTMVCLVVTLLLVATYQLTLPYIEAAKAAAADAGRRAVAPQADSFLPYDGALPEHVDSIYLARSSGQPAGCVVSCSAKGFNGPVVVVCGFAADGTLSGLRVSEHSETPGLGTKVAADGYTAQFVGLDATNYQGVDAVSGATVTSTALKQAVATACAAAAPVLEGGAGK